MRILRKAGGLRAAVTMLAATGAIAVGCIDRPVSTVRPRTQSGVSEEIRNDAIEKVDLLLMVDNSGSMRENQANIMAQFEPLINTLVNPPDMNGDGRPDYPPVKDLHVGVVSSDLGTPGANITGCANSDLGDDGLLNPIRQGQALQDHLPWAPRSGREAAPPGFRPDDCRDPNEFPAFISFCSGAAGAECDGPGSTRDSNQFVRNFRCNAGLFVNGCGLEQQLEAVWRALVWHNPRAVPGNSSPNAGFLREDALLAILMLTDEEDMSTRDCRFAMGQACTDAIDVFQPTSTAWASTNLNLRSYLYQPCGAQDPTWPLERYVNPRDPNAGWLSLKPGHPERVVFAAITGVPLEVPTRTDGGEQRIDWDALLGAPDPADRENFCGRNTETAVTVASREGPISMRHANQDPNCSERTVPACRREGSEYNPMRPPCTTMDQYYAWPARRVVEIARRFDESPLCNGGPCRNGIVTSICSNNYRSAMNAIVEKIQSRLSGRCLPRVLQTTRDSENNEIVECLVRETQPSGITACDAARGRVDVPEGVARTVNINGEDRVLCDIQQVPTNPDSRQPVGGRQGWYYDRSGGMGGAGSCSQAISFTEQASPGSGSITRLECIQAVTGVETAGGE